MPEKSAFPQLPKGTSAIGEFLDVNVLMVFLQGHGKSQKSDFAKWQRCFWVFFSNPKCALVFSGLGASVFQANFHKKRGRRSSGEMKYIFM